MAWNRGVCCFPWRFPALADGLFSSLSDMCKVSVIIPNYNYAGYLHERIASVLNQTYQDFELILLDDASTDNSAEILYGYKDNPHVTHIDINERNTGSPFQQWFKGMALAKGEYIWLAESDDLCNSAFLEKTVRLLDAHPDVAVCFAGSSLIDQDGHVLPRDINKWGRAERKREYGVFDGRDYAEHNLYWKNYVPNASGVLFRKSSFLKADVAQCVRMRYCGTGCFGSNCFFRVTSSSCIVWRTFSDNMRGKLR